MKIAIIRLSALGDIIQTATVVHFIKKHFSSAHISWVCDERFAKILEQIPDIDKIIKIPLKDKKITKSFLTLLANRRKFDYILDFQGLIKSAICAKILGTNSYGFDENSIKENVASKFYKHKIACDYNENVVIRYLTLASKALGFSFEEKEILEKPKIFSSAKYGLEPTNKKKVLIAPFASEYSKCYPHFKFVVHDLIKDAQVYVCYGNKTEYNLALKIIFGSDAVLLPKMDILKMTGVVEEMDLVIGNDSAIPHLAWAQNKPSITLFGNRPSTRNAFVTPINLVADVGKFIDAKHIDKKDFCIKEIDPNLICELARKLLNG